MGPENVVKGAALLFLVLSISSVAAAKGFSVDTDVDNRNVNPLKDESAEIHVSVTNNGAEKRTFAINYQASNPGWYFLPDYSLVVPAGETRNATLYAHPGKEALEGNVGVIITVSSDGEKVTKRPSYSIVRDRDLLITEMRTDSDSYRPGELVNATLDIKNVRSHDLGWNEYRAVFSMAGEAKTVPVPHMIAGQEERLEAAFQLDDQAAGNREVTVRVETLDGQVQDSRTANIGIEDTENIQVEQSTAFQLLTSEGRINITNDGNVESGITTVSTDIPGYLRFFTSFDTQPSEIWSQGWNTVYTWDVAALEPGESRTISYTVNHWVPVAILVLVLLSVGIAVREYRKPTIDKQVYTKNGTRSVHIRVKNRSGRTVDDMVVKDFIPSIHSLVEKFDASPPDRIRRGEETTEVEWRLGRFEPGEERILTYSIRPQVEVEGDVTLPSAHLEYESRGTEKKRHSHPARARLP